MSRACAVLEEGRLLGCLCGVLATYYASVTEKCTVLEGAEGRHHAFGGEQ